jgi:hypothetical protein
MALSIRCFVPLAFGVGLLAGASNAQLKIENAPAPAPAATKPAAPAPAPERRALNRPPMEGSSYDIGRYELRKIEDRIMPKFTEDVREIEAKLGEVFGFTWRIRTFSGTRPVPIKTVVKHPAYTPKGQTSPQTLTEEKMFFKPINGTLDWQFIFKFDSIEELVPGEWLLAVYYDTELIAEHTFSVVENKKVK